jgi:hypothetical protein
MSDAPDRTLDDPYRIQVFAEADGVEPQDVLDLWAREAAVPAEAAQRRLDQIHLVATHGIDGLVGVTTAYLRRNRQLRTTMWYYRAFVAPAHRISNIAALLATWGLDDLEARFTSGADRRGAGLVFEVENEGLKRYFSEAVWMPRGMTFVGENERGDHVRVHWFPGAVAPPPPGPA